MTDGSWQGKKEVDEDDTWWKAVTGTTMVATEERVSVGADKAK